MDSVGRWSQIVALFFSQTVMGILPVYSFFALTTKMEMFILGVPFGLQIGSIQAFSRSTFAELIPKGYEAEFYSFYAITDRG